MIRIPPPFKEVDDEAGFGREYLSIQFQSPQHKKDMLEQVWGRATKIIKELEQLSCEERPREMGLFSMEKKRLQAYFVAAFLCLKRAM